MRNELKTPPPFVRCDKCDGDGYILDDCNGNAMLGELPIDTKCSKCADSPLHGWLTQYYTPEQYRVWIRRENGLPEYELPDSMPVWVEPAENNGWKWTIKKYEYAKTMCIKRKNEGSKVRKVHIIIATESGRPPEDWRPE